MVVAHALKAIVEKTELVTFVSIRFRLVILILLVIIPREVSAKEDRRLSMINGLCILFQAARSTARFEGSSPVCSGKYASLAKHLTSFCSQSLRAHRTTDWYER